MAKMVNIFENVVVTFEFMLFGT